MLDRRPKMTSVSLIDSASSSPRYQQVRREMLRRIATGRYPVGTQIDREDRLAVEFDVSRSTIRKAFELLTDEGVLSREQGRGTFVRRTPDLFLDFQYSASITDLLERSRRGRTSGSHIDIRPVASFPPEVRANLEGAESGLHVERILLADTRPVTRITDYVAASVAHAVSLDTMASVGIMAALEAHGIALVRARSIITAEETTAEVARSLGQPAGSAVLREERVLYGADDVPLVFTVTLHVGGMYGYVVDYAPSV